MKNKYRLYINGCSYVDGFNTPNSILSNKFKDLHSNRLDTHSVNAGVGGDNNDGIFRRTIIDCSKHKFDFAIICWSHSTRWIANDFTVDFESDNENIKKLQKDTESKWYPKGIVPNGYIDSAKATEMLDCDELQLLCSEPYATDRTIFHTISLHYFFKQKKIPHLFLNMGELNPHIIKARKDWLYQIDSKNYLSYKEEDIVNKMKFCFTQYYSELHKPKPILTQREKDIITKSSPYKGFQYSDYYKNNYIVDEGNHLGALAMNDINNLIIEHILKHNLLK